MDFNYHELSSWRNDIEKQCPSIKIVVTNGCFDILHFGHCEMLASARKLGDMLVVGLNSDRSIRHLKGPFRPINTQEQRRGVLKALRVVDEVYIFDDIRCYHFLRAMRPHIYVKAGDYSIDSLDLEERKALLDCKAEIVFTSLIPGLSTSDIIKKLK